MELVMALWPFEGPPPDDDNNEPHHQNRGTTIKMVPTASPKSLAVNWRTSNSVVLAAFA
ncbi:uncharacterized protein BDZ99DRAFT_152743 [Mytilinidion resinicola]|uniref:Uncharacterized protein n=1 Tax=Mytilinidion resinicola TaxID=574789 RepID=A0A6A6Y6I0_9PEZI|nr:uncharacterized protein BDZ99DRAFT_152743 [Mytilinidion resinicola]KAF2804431.1 hypothetical protein BDZ99DRAFT_152743 [Mytilinidion resinicola]